MGNNDYDRAIEAYHFQVNRYHTWMNYYSLFHGALLIAFYSIQCDVNVNDDRQWLPFIIALLGFLAGICWCYTVIGNMNWINNWMGIIKKVASENDKIGDNIYNVISLKCDTGLLSTQKVMLLFTIMVTIAWGVVSCLSFPLNKLWAIIGLIVVVGGAILLFRDKKSFIHSDINGMKTIEL